jgi:ABC-type proline/glycine betaine transport system substrate-binding protein
MDRSRLAAILAGLVIVSGVTQAIGKGACRPDVTIKNIRFSEVGSSTRVWTALLNVDASRCAASSGRFEVILNRLKDNAPDLTFSEWFPWRPGETEVSLSFWEDESVLDYSIGAIAPCACRD